MSGREGREAGRAGKDSKYEVCLKHSHGRTACTLANASESSRLSAEKALVTLGGVMAFLVVLRSSLFSICSCSAFLLGLSVADGINTACVGFSLLHTDYCVVSDFDSGKILIFR